MLDGVRPTPFGGVRRRGPGRSVAQHHQHRLVPLKLYTLYSPPNHRDGVMHHTHAEAEADNEEFDGKTTE